MKKNLTALGLFVAGFMMVIGPAVSFAGQTKVSGFGSILLPLSDEAQDNGSVVDVDGTTKNCTDGDGNNANCTELQFSADAEVDFEHTEGAVTVRLDLDIPNKAGRTFVDHIEQIRFDWAPSGAPAGLTLTGGVFNTPIGNEGQDAVDLNTITTGRLFNLLPVNHAGLQLGGGQGPVSGNLLFVNDFNGDAASLKEENSYGATVSFKPMPVVGVTVGYITSEGQPDPTTLAKIFAGDPNVGISNGDVLDVIVSGGVMPSSDLDLNYAVEYVNTEDTDSFGVTLHAQHGPHGATVRYESVDLDVITPTSLTVAVNADLESNLGVTLEYRSDDPDTAADSTDKVSLQFLATF